MGAGKTPPSSGKGAFGGGPLKKKAGEALGGPQRSKPGWRGGWGGGLDASCGHACWRGGGRGKGGGQSPGGPGRGFKKQGEQWGDPIFRGKGAATGSGSGKNGANGGREGPFSWAPFKVKRRKVKFPPNLNFGKKVGWGVFGESWGFPRDKAAGEKNRRGPLGRGAYLACCWFWRAARGQGGGPQKKGGGAGSGGREGPEGEGGGGGGKRRGGKKKRREGIWVWAPKGGRGVFRFFFY